MNTSALDTPLPARPARRRLQRRRRGPGWLLVSPSVALLLLWMIVPLGMTLFRWPTRKRSGRPSPILCGDLLRAVRTECAESVQFWWGFSPSLVGRWRRALGVTRRNNPGDQAVARARAALARSLDRKAPPKAPAAWSSEEVEFIRRHGSKRSLAWCAYMLGRSYQSVASKAEELSPHSGRDRNNAIWSKSEEDLLRQHYQQRGSLWCAQQTGKTRAAVFHRAKKLGLQRQRPKHP